MLIKLTIISYSILMIISYSIVFLLSSMSAIPENLLNVKLEIHTTSPFLEKVYPWQ